MVNLIWCPEPDYALGQSMAAFIDSFPNTHKKGLVGGKKQLGAFNPLTDKLYILVHGHEQMPVFSIMPKTWSANELVELLHSDGLPTTWREIELLVCYAGASVNTKKIGDELLGLRQNMLDLRKKGVPKEAPEIKQLLKKFGVVTAKGQAPSAFRFDTQAVPLAALFVQALKSHKYTNFRVTSYAAKVAQNLSEGKVTLDLRSWGGGWSEPLSQHADKIKIWH